MLIILLKEFINLNVNADRKRVKRIDKNGEEIIEIISYRLRFIQNARFMTSLLSNLVKNLSKGIHKFKCKYRNDDMNYETGGTENNALDCIPEFTNFKDNLLYYNAIVFVVTSIIRNIR